MDFKKLSAFLEENGLPAFLAQPPRLPGEWTPPPAAPADSVTAQPAPPRG